MTNGVIVVPRQVAGEVVFEMAAKKTADEKERLLVDYTGAPAPASKFGALYKKFGMEEYDGAWDEPV